MKISQFISVLEDLKKEFGDKHIWSLDDLSFPLPSSFEIELTNRLTRTNYGTKGGKAKDMTKAEVSLEFEGGVNLVDRCITEMSAED